MGLFRGAIATPHIAVYFTGKVGDLIVETIATGKLNIQLHQMSRLKMSFFKKV